MSIKTIRKKIKYAILYAFIKFLIWLAYVLPRRYTLSIYKSLGVFAHKLFKSQQRLIEKHINYAYDTQMSEQDASKFSRNVFENIAKNTADIFIASSFKSSEKLDQWIDFEGLHHLEEAYQKGKGVIALTCHMGAFELIGDILSNRYPTNIIVKKLHNPKLNSLLAENREKRGGKVLYSGEGMLKVVRQLQLGEVVIILIDQDIPKVKGVFVDFYGKPAYTPIGAAWLAMNTDAVVLPISIRRTQNERHLFTVSPAVEIEHGINAAESIQLNTQNYTVALESLIREDPAQWVWMHKRWKTKPKESVLT